MIRDELELAIKNGLSFIEKEAKENIFWKEKTPFVAILGWQALSVIESQKAKEIVNLGVRELIKEKNKNGSFNYWLKKSEQYKREPYPNDMDDTFCAWRVIYNSEPKLIKGKDLALIANILIFNEEKTGGPYRTWIWPKENKDWVEIDVAVNSNIQYFLKTQEIELKNIKKIIEESVLNKNFKSVHYPENQVIYFFSRVYEGKNKEILISYIKEKLKKEILPGEMAILLSSLIRLGNEIEQKEIERLIKLQNKDGSWKENNFYHYKKNLYVKNKNLTTALVLETLSLYQRKKKTEQKRDELKEIGQKIIAETKKTLAELNPMIKKQADLLLKKITRGNATEIIILTPYLTAKSLKEKYVIEEQFLIELGVINMLGWMAYSAYDDLIDNDKTIEWLSMANAICRKMDIKFCQLLPKNREFLSEYQKIMNELEEANLWEMKNCRDINKNPNFKRVEKLSNRSLGHAVTSLAILYKIGAGKNEIGNLKKFFTYFLAARQMNDDAHDWEKDLKKGQINSASSEILKLTKDIENEENLRLIFWEEVFDKYAKRILKYCQKAKKNISQIGCLNNTLIFDRMVDKVIKSTQLAMEEKKNSVDFINNYYKK